MQVEQDGMALFSLQLQQQQAVQQQQQQQHQQRLETTPEEPEQTSVDNTSIEQPFKPSLIKHIIAAIVTTIFCGGAFAFQLYSNSGEF